jgi:CubicO group peptidase (beta-lactamase class C family)
VTTKNVPGQAWERGPTNADLDEAVQALCTDDALPGTLAVVVIQRGRIIAERYQPDTSPNIFDPEPRPTTADSTLISWSMAKSVTHALAGLAVADGRLELDAPAPVPEWRGTSREPITLQQMLNMRSGLDYVEDYVDGDVSHVIDMLFGSGKDDVAAYAAARPLKHPPGEVWNYSSGETNIVSRIIGNTLGGTRAVMEAHINTRLFAPIGMSSATAKFDPAGTFIGSSFVYATARDFARFGLLYLRDGWWGEQQILPSGWVDHGRRPTPVPDTEPHGYGAHWWLWPYEQSMACHGYEGQRCIVLPDRDAVVVRLGKTNEVHNDLLRAHLHQVIGALSA